MRIVAVLLLYLAAASSNPMAGKWNADLRTSILPEGFPQLRSQTMELRWSQASFNAQRSGWT